MHDRLGVNPQVIEYSMAGTRPNAELLTSHPADLGNELCALVCDEPVLHWSVRLRAPAPSIMIARPCRSMRSPAGA